MRDRAAVEARVVAAPQLAASIGAMRWIWPQGDERCVRVLSHEAAILAIAADLRAAPVESWDRTADVELRLVYELWRGGYKLRTSAELHPEDLPTLCTRFALLGGMVFPAANRPRPRI